MADFGIESTSLSAPQGAGSTPVAPVQQAPDSRNLPIDGFGSLIGSFFKDKAKSTSPIIAELNDKLNIISQGVDAGTISASRAQAERNIATTAALGAAGGNLEIAKGIKSLVETYTGITSLEDAAEQRKYERQYDQQVITGLRDAGFTVANNPSPQLMQTYHEMYQRSKTAEVEFKQKMDNLNYASNSYKFDRETEQYSKQQAVNSFVTSNLPSATDVIYQTAMDMRSKIGVDGFTFQNATTEIDNSVNFFNNQLLQLYPDSPEYVSQVTSYIKNWGERVKEGISPQGNLDALDAQLKEMKIKDQLVLMSNGNIRAGMAIDSASPDNPIIKQSLGAEMVNILGPLAMTFSPDASMSMGNVNLKPAVEKKQVYGFAKESIKSVQRVLSGSPDTIQAGSQEARDNLVNNLLIQGGQMGLNPDGFKAADAMDFVNFLASEEFALWHKTGTVNPQAREAAQDMFDSVMLRKVQQPIVNTLNEKLRSTRLANADESSFFGSGFGLVKLPEMSNMDLFKVDFDGSVVRFVPRSNEELGIDPKVDFRGNIPKQTVDQMNKQAIVLNTLIRAGANLSGATSTSAYWEANKQNILPYYYPPAMPNIKVGDVVDGKQYIGGAVQSRFSWKPVTSGVADE